MVFPSVIKLETLSVSLVSLYIIKHCIEFLFDTYCIRMILLLGLFDWITLYPPGSLYYILPSRSEGENGLAELVDRQQNMQI